MENYLRLEDRYDPKNFQHRCDQQQRHGGEDFLAVFTKAACQSETQSMLRSQSDLSIIVRDSLKQHRSHWTFNNCERLEFLSTAPQHKSHWTFNISKRVEHSSIAQNIYFSSTATPISLTFLHIVHCILYSSALVVILCLCCGGCVVPISYFKSTADQKLSF